MAWTWYQKAIAVLMVVTGSINTLATKWADQTKSVGRYGGEPRLFDHPFLQACSMFLGELLCLFVFKILYQYYSKRKAVEDLPVTVQGNQNFNPIIFYAPALCDMIGTSVMYIGLNLTYASSFQMLRGSVIIFTGLFSVAFLHRQLKAYEWIGIVVVIIGLACVGASDVLYSNDVTIDTNKILTGDLLIIMAQIVVATQMVIEERFVMKHNVNPLQGVGWEGFFGFMTLSVLLIPMYFIKVHGEGLLIFHSPGGRLEDAIDGFYQIANNWQVAVGISGTVLSIAFFNFAGLSVTKELSATTRMVLDSVRTFVIWIFSLLIGWSKFNYLQVVGFLILLIGMCLYNDVLIRPMFNKYRERSRRGETAPLLRSTENEADPSSSPYFHASQKDIKPGSINA